MISKLTLFFTRQFAFFLICGASAAGVNIGSRWVFDFLLSFEYPIAIVAAYICGCVTAFVLDKFFVFKNGKRKTGRQIAGFLIVNLLGLIQTFVVSLMLRDLIFPAFNFLFYPDGIAHIIGVGIPVFTSFIGHKYFSF
jgi:putative flippase GtrA